MTRSSLARAAAHDAIDSEREYQDTVWGQTASSGQPGNGSRTLDEWVLYIAGYSNDLVSYASHEDNPTEKLNIIRKIAGMCVAAMEDHGAPKR